MNDVILSGWYSIELFIMKTVHTGFHSDETHKRKEKGSEKSFWKRSQAPRVVAVLDLAVVVGCELRRFFPFWKHHEYVGVQCERFCQKSSRIAGASGCCCQHHVGKMLLLLL